MNVLLNARELLALLKAQVSLQLGKSFSLHNVLFNLLAFT